MIDQFPEPGTPLPPQFQSADPKARDLEDPDRWRDEALCAQTDPEIFYPEFGKNAKQALKVCAECPVRTQCLQWALDTHETYGILGGTTGNQRRQMLAGKPRPEPKHGTDHMYRLGCRTDGDCPNKYTCAQAHRDYQREWEHKQRANGKPSRWKKGAA